MKQKWKRALCIALGLVLTAGSLPDAQTLFPDSALTAYAEEGGECGENIFWTLEDGVLTISGTGDMQDYLDDITDGAAPWYDQRTSIERIVLEEGITSIGAYAFWGCSALKTIKLPEGIRSIGRGAFKECSSLYTVYLSDGVESIGVRAFAACKQLRTVRIPESVTMIGVYAFEDTQWLSKHQEESPLVIVNNIVISGELCNEAVRIPEGVTTIADYAFYKADSLEAVILPSSLRTIGENAFAGCVWLSKIIIPEGLTEIGPYAFEQADSLTSVSLPDSVTAIGSYAFHGCDRLEKVTMPKQLTSLGEYTFGGCLALKQITIPENLTEIPERMFWKCRSLTAVSIPDGVQRIGTEAFCECNDLTDLTVPKRTTEIGGWAFRNTAWLAARQKENPLVIVNKILIDGSTCEGDVVIPNGVKKIVENAFEGCTEMKRVKIPQSVSVIGKRAFALCSSMKEIWFMNPKCNIQGAEDTIFDHFTSPDRYVMAFDGVVRGYAGSTAEAYANANEYKFQAIPPMRGDYNGDFAVSAADAVILARFAAEHKTLTDAQISHILAANPDYDGDGGITITDVTALLADIAGKQS